MSSALCWIRIIRCQTANLKLLVIRAETSAVFCLQDYIICNYIQPFLALRITSKKLVQIYNAHRLLKKKKVI